VIVGAVLVLRDGESEAPSAAEVRTYVAAVEQVRLPVNRLLENADPILEGFKSKTITPAVAEQRMDALERRFATYVTAINSIAPANERLAAIHAPYARTYFFEDAYLSALAADLSDGNFAGLPTTQNDQRLAIIEWRVQLELQAKARGVALPADIEQAGRGEIAPSP
jgi:hypothetical protein